FRVAAIQTGTKFWRWDAAVTKSKRAPKAHSALIGRKFRCLRDSRARPLNCTKRSQEKHGPTHQHRGQWDANAHRGARFDREQYFEREHHRLQAGSGIL